MKKTILFSGLVFFCVQSFSQGCAMCVEALESHIEAGGSEGSGINSAIIYLMVTPYLAILIFASLWYIQNRKNIEIKK